MSRIVADVGNSRIKFGRLARDDSIEATRALTLAELVGGACDLDAWFGPGVSTWAVASVNPPALDALLDEVRRRGGILVRLDRSAADVPVRHGLATPQTTGSDRALAVLAALGRHPEGGPGQVVSCGTAVTVERIGPDGLWYGGAIAPGLVPMAQALHRSTAQLPRVAVDLDPPAPWGDATEPALVAGIFWSVVGAIRELLERQSRGFDRTPWRVWTGGDAAVFARLVEGDKAVVLPDLVLEGLARAAFG